nr:hypothetical protein [Brucella abortus]
MWDPKARRDFWDEIHRLADGGLTVLVSTHYMDEAERCHRINYISYGKLLATGTVSEVIERTGSPLSSSVESGSAMWRESLKKCRASIRSRLSGLHCMWSALTGRS